MEAPPRGGVFSSSDCIVSGTSCRCCAWPGAARRGRPKRPCGRLRSSPWSRRYRRLGEAPQPPPLRALRVFVNLQKTCFIFRRRLPGRWSPLGPAAWVGLSKPWHLRRPQSALAAPGPADLPAATAAPCCVLIGCCQAWKSEELLLQWARRLRQERRQSGQAVRSTAGLALKHGANSSTLSTRAAGCHRAHRGLGQERAVWLR